jgi:hypothetical protein
VAPENPWQLNWSADRNKEGSKKSKKGKSNKNILLFLPFLLPLISTYSP